MSGTDVTRVIFRVFRNKRDGRAVIALFPDLPGTNDPGTCLSYMHDGQHGPANLLDMMYRRSRPAAPEEYADLRQELEGPPYKYRLAVIRRTRWDCAAKRAGALRLPTERN